MKCVVGSATAIFQYQLPNRDREGYCINNYISVQQKYLFETIKMFFEQRKPLISIFLALFIEIKITSVPLE